MALKLTVTIIKDYVFENDLRVYRMKATNKHHMPVDIVWTDIEDLRVLGERITKFLAETQVKGFWEAI